MKCKACGKQGVRRTVTAIVLGEQGAARGRICAACVSRGIFVVPTVVPSVVRVDPGAGKSATEVLRPFVKACAARAKAYREAALSDEDEIRALAWEAAAAMLKEGRT